MRAHYQPIAEHMCIDLTQEGIYVEREPRVEFSREGRLWSFELKLDQDYVKNDKDQKFFIIFHLNGDTHHFCAVIATLGMSGDKKTRLCGFVTAMPGCA